MKTKIMVSLFLILILGLVGAAVDIGGKVSQVAMAQMVADSSGADPITVYPLGFSSEPATGTITCVAGSRIANGRTITLKNANGNSFTYQFYNGTGVIPPNAVPYDTNMSDADVAQAIAAALTPTLVNGSWAGPRITFSVSGATLYLTQGRSGTSGNNPIGGTAQLDGFIFAGFAGGVTDDRVNIQAAFDSVAPGGTVILKATDPSGKPTAFDFGKFEYFLYVSPAAPLNSRAQPNINNHRVFIDKAMTVQGETVAEYTTTVKNGFETFAIGLNSIPTGPGPITIDGIHFEDAGYTPIYAEQSGVPITITNNTITNHLSDLSAGTAKPGWNSSLSNNWGNPEDGTHITMVHFEVKDHTFTDVTVHYTKAERVAAFLAAEASMAFDSRAVYITDGNGQNAPYYGRWFAPGIGLFNAYGPLGLLMVPLTISGNDIDQNATLPASQFTPVWSLDIGIYTQGHTSSENKILGNHIQNVGYEGIFVLDDTGNLTIQGNLVEIGPAGGYAEPNALVPPRIGADAISVRYNVFDVYQYPPNVPITYPTIGGNVSIVGNTVTNSSSYSDECDQEGPDLPGKFRDRDLSQGADDVHDGTHRRCHGPDHDINKDAGGITIGGDNASFFNSLAIVGNQVQITNGRHGIQINATDVPGASGPTVSQNTVTGSGFSGLLLGLATGIPRDTVNISVTDVDLSGYTATSAGTSFPHWPAAFVYLGSDTHNNTGTKICVPATTTYSEFIRDLGTDNDFEPSCSAIAMTGYLIEKVNHFNLQEGLDKSLERKLRNVLGSLTAEDADQRQDATNMLNAFINECQAQSGKKLTVDQAQELIAVANDIITTLTAGPQRHPYRHAEDHEPR